MSRIQPSRNANYSGSRVRADIRELEEALLNGELIGDDSDWLEWITALDSVGDRVLMRCKEDPATGCLEWQGAKSVGYGRIKIAGKLYLAHRMVAYSAGIVEWPEDPERKECVMHLCDNPACCNPSHMQAGTMSDNMRDAARKGRLSFPRPRKKASG